MPSRSVKDVDQHEFVKVFAEYLKKTGKINVPKWADIMKLSRANVLAPTDPDWFFTRLASIVRHLYIRSPAGVGAFTKIYGQRKRNGTAPSHWVRGLGSIERRALQILEEQKLVKKHPKGGRALTPLARKQCDHIAQQIFVVTKGTIC